MYLFNIFHAQDPAVTPMVCGNPEPSQVSRYATKVGVKSIPGRSAESDQPLARLGAMTPVGSGI